MSMMPGAAHRAEQLSEIVHCWFSGSQKNNTWLVETLQYMLSTFELFVVLFLLSWLLRRTDLFAFFVVESLAVGCVQHSFLHLTPPNTYVAKGLPHCPPRPPSPRNVVQCPPNSFLHRRPRVSVTPLSVSAN